jgi:hypothetical protein
MERQGIKANKVFFIPACLLGMIFPVDNLTASIFEERFGYLPQGPVSRGRKRAVGGRRSVFKVQRYSNQRVCSLSSLIGPLIIGL